MVFCNSIKSCHIKLISDTKQQNRLKKWSIWY